MKRILIYGLSDTWGGTESYFMTVYQAVDHSKIQFDFLFPYYTGKIPYERTVIAAGGKIYREYYQHHERKLAGAVSIKEFFDRHEGEWDGVYINIQTINTAYRLLVEAGRRGMKYRVIHAHNSNYPHRPTVKNRLYELYFHLTKERYVTHFLACSAEAGRFAFHSSSCNVIPDAVDFEYFRHDPKKRQDMRIKYHIADEAAVVGMCARLVYQKNTEFALEIFRAFHEKKPHSCFLMVGEGPERVKLEKKIKEYHLEDSVILTGAVDNVPDYLQMMDLFLLPSRFEGFGIALLEAQAAGLECFTSAGAVPCDINLTGHVHFIDLKETESFWAGKMLESDSVRYDEMELLKNSGYTVESAVRKLMDVFCVDS